MVDAVRRPQADSARLELGGLPDLHDFLLVRAERPGGGAIEQLDVEPSSSSRPPDGR